MVIKDCYIRQYGSTVPVKYQNMRILLKSSRNTSTVLVSIWSRLLPELVLILCRALTWLHFACIFKAIIHVNSKVYQVLFVLGTCSIINFLIYIKKIVYNEVHVYITFMIHV